jgi:hypothetical protein
MTPLESATLSFVGLGIVILLLWLGLYIRLQCLMVGNRQSGHERYSQCLWSHIVLQDIVMLCVAILSLSIGVGNIYGNAFEVFSSIVSIIVCIILIIVFGYLFL